MTGRLPNVSPQVQQEIAVLLANGDREGATLRLRRYRSNEENDYVVQRSRSEWAALETRKSGNRLLIVFILLALAAALALWLIRKH